MNHIAFTLYEIGISPLIIILIAIFGGFFLLSFAITTPNMDTKGLLRVLHSKPQRKPDGSVEYTDGD
ncbi:hypothetical protein [Prochlorococcus sp. MIT 1223]|uniref:hypothetical protein n=1 Tax=Prochlorococcus sp. MIT 1223 TaxID=3096217 RepID=UPI002A749FC7|nr:hypothetical protein [Prochlorococcus sp. MIT 1223]